MYVKTLGNFMHPRIALPVSHLFKDQSNIEKLSGLYDCLEVRPQSIACNLTGQELIHADCIQPIHELTDSDFKLLEKIRDKKKGLKLISFHCASCCPDPISVDGVFHISNGHFYTRDQMYDNAQKNIGLIRDIFGSKMKIVIENNNYYPTTAYDHVTDAAFISDIVNDNDIEFLFDNAHARVTAHNLNIDYLEYRDSLPLDKMIQIQFCEPMIPNDGIARDVHDFPSHETINEMVDLAAQYHVQYITPEYYKDITMLCELLTDLRKIYEYRSGGKNCNNNRC
tara:strand:- start:368 stop:1213 length:846 start_codon:yes stop_codon:yes gene_type:complete